MDNLATNMASAGAPIDGAERRAATRFTSLIRAAKLFVNGGEFVCVIRDVSETGISLRTFHKLPDGDPVKLVLQNGEAYHLERVRVNQDNASSFRFANPVNVENLIVEASQFPKRQLRIALEVPVKISTLTQSFSGTIRNMSQQGALLACDALFAIEQPIRLHIGRMPELRAKIRWRQSDAYGTAFDTTFTLGEFARHVAALQAPQLLD